MNDQRRLPAKQSRNQTAQSNIVLEKKIAPVEQAEDFRNRRTAGDSIIRADGFFAGRLRDRVDLVAGYGEFLGENF